MNRPTTIERAYEIARSGSVENVDAVARQLKREQFEAVDQHLMGASTRATLRRLCLEAKQSAVA
jgi:hypothetical protein